MGALMSMDAINSVAAYESMCRWITECEDRAECKDIADKSKAMEEYAKRLNNFEAERRACNVRLVAERRYGELLAELARTTPAEAGAQGGRGNVKAPAESAAALSPYREAIERDGIDERKARRLQALANVPQETFDAALGQPAKPTTTGILEKKKAMEQVREARDPCPRIPSDALWLWGRMNDFERDGYARKDPADLLEHMTDAMRADVLRIAPLMADFFGRIKEITREPA